MIRALAGLSLVVAMSTHAADTVEVLVAARDLPEGTVVTKKDFVARAYPSARATSSLVKPASVEYLVGQRMLVPALAGDPIFWASLETRTDPQTVEACLRVVGTGTAPQQVARARAAVTAASSASSSP